MTPKPPSKNLRIWSVFLHLLEFAFIVLYIKTFCRRSILSSSFLLFNEQGCYTSCTIRLKITLSYALSWKVTDWIWLLANGPSSPNHSTRWHWHRLSPGTFWIKSTRWESTSLMPMLCNASIKAAAVHRCSLWCFKEVIPYKCKAAIQAWDVFQRMILTPI